ESLLDPRPSPVLLTVHEHDRREAGEILLAPLPERVDQRSAARDHVLHERAPVAGGNRSLEPAPRAVLLRGLAYGEHGNRPTGPPAARTWRSSSPHFRSASTSDPPLVITSSTSATRSPAVTDPSSQRRAPCSFAVLRTENHETGRAVRALWYATAAAIGSAPMVGPPTATASAGRS